MTRPLLLLISLLLVVSSVTRAAGNNTGKYYLLEGEPKTSALRAIVEKPADMAVRYRQELADMGAELMAYYFAVNRSRMYAIIRFPDSNTAAAHLYQRMSTGVMRDLEITEIMPSDEMESVLQHAAELDAVFKSKGNAARE